MNIQLAKLSLVDGEQRQAPPEIASVSVRRGMLYLLVEVSAPLEEWDNASREIIAKATESFTTSKLGETNALQAAATTVNDYLLARNKILSKEDRIWAGFNAAFIRDNELFLAQAGPALTYIARDNSVTRYPKSFEELQANREALTPLGEQQGIKCRLARFSLAPNDLVVLAASHLPTFGAEGAINQAIQRPDTGEVVAALLKLAKGQDFSSLVLQYEPAAKATPPKTVAPAVPQNQDDDEWDDDDAWDEWEGDEWEEEVEEATDDEWGIPSAPAAPAKAASTATAIGKKEPVQPPESSSNKKATPPSDKKATSPKKEPTRPAAPQESRPSQATARPVPPAPRTPQEPPRTPPSAARAPRGQDAPARPTDPTVRLPQADKEPSRPTVSARIVPPEQPKGAANQPPPRSTPAESAVSSPKSRAIPVGAPREPEVVASTARPMDPQSKKEPGRTPTTPPLAPLAPHLSPADARAQGVAVGATDWQSLLRRMGAWLLGVGVWLLGLLSKSLGWLRQSLRPRAVAAGPSLDRATHGLGETLQRFLQATLRVLRQVLPGNHTEPPPTRTVVLTPGDGSGFLRTATVAIPLLVLLLGLALWSFRGATEPAQTPAAQAALAPGGNGNYAALVGEAQTYLTQAASVDEATAQPLLMQATNRLDEAAALALDDAQRREVEALRLQAQSLQNRAGTILRPPSTTLVQLDPDSQPAALLYGANTLFLLEKTHASVYRLLPDQPPPGTLQTVAPLLSAQQRLAEGVVVETPQEVTWVPAGGGRSHEGLLVLTAQGQMFDYDAGSGLLRQLAFPSLTTALQASEGYGGNLYLLDGTNRQIWKYVPNGQGEYPDAPQPWLTATGQGQLGAPIDMAIDGYIFLLDQNGAVRRFQVGEQQAAFALDPVNPPLSQPVALAKVPPETSDLFVADSQRVLRFDQNGRFLVEYRAPLGGDWGTIRDIAVDEKNELLYVLSNQGLYIVDIRNTRRVPPTQ